MAGSLLVQGLCFLEFTRFVRGDFAGLVAFDDVLGVILGGRNLVAFDLCWTGLLLHDLTGAVPTRRVPGYFVTTLQGLCHSKLFPPIDRLRHRVGTSFQEVRSRHDHTFAA